MIKKLKKDFEKIVNDYVIIFSAKQELDLDYWVADKIGETAQFGDYFFNFSDIKYDINTNQPKDNIINWHNHIVENADLKCNYESWCRGYDKIIEEKLKLNNIFEANLGNDFIKIFNNVDRTYKPDYYKSGDMDVIAFCNYHNLGFNEGSAIKYLVRAGKKDNNTRLQDLKKSLEYLNRMIKFEENK